MAKNNYRSRGTDTPDAPRSIVKIDSKAQAAKVAEAEQVDIFDIDGVVYSMPNAQRADISLRYLEMQEEDGPDAAALWLLQQSLGEDALAALSGVVGLEGAQFDAVMETVRSIVLPKDRGRR